MSDEELAEIEEVIPYSGESYLRYAVRKLIAEVRRQRAENRALQSRLDIAEGRVEGMRGEIENLAGELRDEKAYAKELRENFGEAGMY